MRADPIPDDRNELARIIAQTCQLTGSFKLRSGQFSDHYFDKYRFEADPALLSRVAQALAPLVPDDTELLAGLELGGIPIATVLSGITGISARFVRKARKPYGTMALAEGGEIAGKRLTIIEDVVTTGGQILDSVKQLRTLGGEVNTVLCVIQRNQFAGEATAVFAEEGLELRSLFEEAELLAPEFLNEPDQATGHDRTAD
ncbi:MAG: orotate phosphoribosyltransferase [Gammaproteobacteria bacterium]|nr:orotate phosphoribosyltransferase [Gammaproteobacteria bacterium]